MVEQASTCIKTQDFASQYFAPLLLQPLLGIRMFAAYSTKNYGIIGFFADYRGHSSRDSHSYRGVSQETYCVNKSSFHPEKGFFYSEQL